MKTVLAPIDFSSVTDAVVGEATALARAFNGRVVLLSVIQPPAMISEYAPLIENIGEIVAAGEKNAARQLANWEKVAAASVATESILLTGAPVPHVIEQAKKLPADYIVMGSHGHGAFYDLLVGSTTHGVLTRATCPVIIVPAARQAKSEKPKKELAAAV